MGERPDEQRRPQYFGKVAKHEKGLHRGGWCHCRECINYAAPTLWAWLTLGNLINYLVAFYAFALVHGRIFRNKSDIDELIYGQQHVIETRVRLRHF